MARIRSFNLDRWSEPDEQRRVRHIGMADARETFDKLKKHLDAYTNWGGSERGSKEDILSELQKEMGLEQSEGVEQQMGGMQI